MGTQIALGRPGLAPNQEGVWYESSAPCLRHPHGSPQACVWSEYTSPSSFSKSSSPQSEQGLRLLHCPLASCGPFVVISRHPEH